MTDKPPIDLEARSESLRRKVGADVELFMHDLLDLAEKSIPDKGIICVIVREDGKPFGTLHNLDTSDEVPSILRRSADKLEKP